MSRVSQAEAKANRERVVAAASRLFREDGVAKVGIADVMKSIGLTQGGFYKQFASKAALVEEAAAKAFADNLQDLEALDQETGEHQAAWQSLLESYFSVDHRDNPGTGCPAAGFAGDVAREPEHRETYAKGVQKVAEWIAPGDAGLAAYATLVGGLILARATAGTPVSEQILRASHAAVASAAGSDQPAHG
ncbi:TetR/AcrR family transcriptional regulator [Streptomyces sp. NPDC088354]|uniref:TetR/AcrR family transcriptional regulator n=1 Tax=unclassified Streptomyces TaxID=2593676 RepID=UPI0029B2D219|nr:TetR/AcrR family transcriptional regulator [Streptomyces sp. MI02-7b]MDX3074168.1 TetR/AcrR family transcriptional regulator [Streptomyces sp. MI02-7b]